MGLFYILIAIVLDTTFYSLPRAMFFFYKLCSNNYYAMSLFRNKWEQKYRYKKHMIVGKQYINNHYAIQIYNFVVLLKQSLSSVENDIFHGILHKTEKNLSNEGWIFLLA